MLHPPGRAPRVLSQKKCETGLSKNRLSEHNKPLDCDTDHLLFHVLMTAAMKAPVRPKHGAKKRQEISKSLRNTLLLLRLILLLMLLLLLLLSRLILLLMLYKPYKALIKKY